MPLLEINDLVKSYARPSGGVHRVVDVKEFSLEAGAQRALRGESGTGKTTFLNLIAGILAPDSGSVRLGGRVARPDLLRGFGERRAAVDRAGAERGSADLLEGERRPRLTGWSDGPRRSDGGVRDRGDRLSLTGCR